MSKVAIIYWSSTGNTTALANSLEESLTSKGAEVSLMTPDSLDGALVSTCDAVALGCPSMGVEVLEECEFEPMWQEIKGSLSGKKVGLFGAYGWGDGEWMRTWEEDAQSAGLSVVGTVICQETPDDDAFSNMADLAGKLV